MILFPSVDLLEGRVVSLVGGKPGTQQVELPRPLDVVQRWVRDGAEWIHVVDLNAAFGTGTNEDLIREALRTRAARFQIGGGVRTESRLKAWLDAGAERVVVGTQGVLDRQWLGRVARKYPDRIVQAVDAEEGRIVTKGWTERTGLGLLEFARSLDGYPLAGLLYTAVQVEGRLQGLDRERIRALADAVDLPLIASGGITTLDDVRFLKASGVDGAVLGLALYNGRIDFGEAQRLANGT